MGELLVGIDVGTQSSKGVLVRPDGTLVAEARAEHGIDVPRPGWAAQDADAVWWARTFARSPGASSPASLTGTGSAASGSARSAPR